MGQLHGLKRVRGAGLSAAREARGGPKSAPTTASREERRYSVGQLHDLTRVRGAGLPAAREARGGPKSAPTTARQRGGQQGHDGRYVFRSAEDWYDQGPSAG